MVDALLQWDAADAAHAIEEGYAHVRSRELMGPRLREHLQRVESLVRRCAPR